jgi:hypothetical protein
MSNYDKPTHRQLFQHFDIQSKTQKQYGDLLNQDTFLDIFFPNDILKGVNDHQRYHELLKRQLDKPTHSNLRVISMSFPWIPQVTSVFQHNGWNLVAIQCMKPRHFVAFINHDDEWYEYDNSPNTFTRVPAPTTILYENGRSVFTTTLFYVRNPSPTEPLAIIAKPQASGNLLRHSLLPTERFPLGHDHSVRPHIQVLTRDGLWNYFHDFPNDDNGHVIICPHEGIRMHYSAMQNVMKHNVLYKTYFYEPDQVKSFEDQVYIPCVYRRYMIILDPQQVSSLDLLLNFLSDHHGGRRIVLCLPPDNIATHPASPHRPNSIYSLSDDDEQEHPNKKKKKKKDKHSPKVSSPKVNSPNDDIAVLKHTKTKKIPAPE